MSLYIGKSNIHGVGVFTNKRLNVNDFILTAIDSNKVITQIGLKVNHSLNPNSFLLFSNNSWNLYAEEIIYPNEEITCNYNINTPSFIKKANPNWK
jgi:hypothetical protein